MKLIATPEHIDRVVSKSSWLALVDGMIAKLNGYHRMSYKMLLIS